MVSFKDVNVYLDGKKIVKTSFAVKNGKFTFKNVKGGSKLNNKFVIVPGFIEEHIHGANKSDTMDEDKNNLHNIATSLTQDGVTSFLPTTMTMSKKAIIFSLKKIASKKYQKGEAKIVGVNLEGPFISETFKGAQDAKYILKPNVKDLTDFVKASNGMIRISTIAIEKADEKFLRALKENHIVCSAGHSNAKYSDVAKALKLGLGCTTHTYNAMSKLHHRDIGLVGASLLHSELYGELILDFHHTSKEAAKLLFKNKDKNKLILISDSMEARYMKNGNYTLGGNKVIVKDGVATLTDGTLAGSVLPLSQALKNAKEISDYSFTEIIDLVTKNPAKNLGLDKKIGIISEKRDADFVIVDKDFNVYQTYVNGELVYSKKNFKF